MKTSFRNLNLFCISKFIKEWIWGLNLMSKGNGGGGLME